MRRMNEGEEAKNLEVAMKVYEKLQLLEKGYDKDQFLMGYLVELEHGTKGNWNITNDNHYDTSYIVLAHLDEDENYYTKLLSLGL